MANAEGLSALINSAESRGVIQGLAVTRGGTSINHLFFANDSILFCKATKEKWEKVRMLLDIYEQG